MATPSRASPSTSIAASVSYHSASRRAFAWALVARHHASRASEAKTWPSVWASRVRWASRSRGSQPSGSCSGLVVMYWSATSGHDVVSVRAWRRYSSALTTPRSTMTPSMRRVPGVGPPRELRVTATMSTSLDSRVVPVGERPVHADRLQVHAPPLPERVGRPARPPPTGGCGAPAARAGIPTRGHCVARGTQAVGVTVDAVIFDWGGTLTPWVSVDGRGWWRIAARLVPPDDVERVGAALHGAEDELWRRARDEHTQRHAGRGLRRGRPGRRRDRLRGPRAGVGAGHVHSIPMRLPLLTGLRERGVRIGVLSNTAWTRARHEQIFVRDGIDHLIDGAVYTCEIAVDQAASGGVPGRDGGGRRDRPGRVRVRRRPAVRRHLRRPPGRHADRSSFRTARSPMSNVDTPTASPTPSSPAWPTCCRSSTAGARPAPDPAGRARRWRG